jgi:hypothetical protein
MPIIGPDADIGLRLELIDWKYVRLLRKWGHYNGKPRKRGKSCGRSVCIKGVDKARTASPRRNQNREL